MSTCFTDFRLQKIHNKYTELAEQEAIGRVLGDPASTSNTGRIFQFGTHLSTPQFRRIGVVK